MRCKSKVERVTPNRYAKDAIDNLEVSCRNTYLGTPCGWNGKLRLLEGHTKVECTLQEVSCTLPRCDLKVHRRGLPEHEEQCATRMLPCTHCAMELLATELLQHQDRCPAAPATCPNQGCGLALAQRYMLASHRDSCAHEMVFCPVAGCGERRLRSLFDAHLREVPVAHSRALVAQVAALSKQLAAAEERLHALGGSSAGDAEQEEALRGAPRMRHA